MLKIVSGGQTGADRAGLDWAIGNGIPYGGWCPKRRRAEDGPIDGRYQLQVALTEICAAPIIAFLTRWTVNSVPSSDGCSGETLRVLWHYKAYSQQ